MSSVRDRLAFFVFDQNAMRHFPGFQINYIEPDMFAKADESGSIAAVHSEGKDAAFADIGNVAHERVVAGSKLPKVCFSAEISELTIQAGDAVVRGVSGGKSFDDFPVVRIDHQEPAVRSAQPPSRGHVELAAVWCNAGSITTAIVLTFPEDLFGFHVEGSEATAGGRIVYCMSLRVAAEAAQAFLEWHLDSPHEPVAVINVENQNPSARTAGLSAIGRAQVKVTLQFGTGGKRGEKAGQQEEKNSAHKKSFSRKGSRRQCGTHSLPERPHCE